MILKRPLLFVMTIVWLATLSAAAGAAFICIGSGGLLRTRDVCAQGETQLGSLETFQALLTATVIPSGGGTATLQFVGNVRFASPVGGSAGLASATQSPRQSLAAAAAAPVGESAHYCVAGGFPGELGASFACTRDADCNGICVSGDDPALATRCTSNAGCNTAHTADGVCGSGATCQEFAVLEIFGSNVFFTGFNVQIRNGAGAFADPNARGNLIVGYNDATQAFPFPVRTGSHNVVIGNDHTYTGDGGLVAGYQNSITARDASITGGSFNVASRVASSVSGGTRNSASGANSSGQWW
jgi:hypothetical protein